MRGNALTGRWIEQSQLLVTNLDSDWRNLHEQLHEQRSAPRIETCSARIDIESVASEDSIIATSNHGSLPHVDGGDSRGSGTAVDDLSFEHEFYVAMVPIHRKASRHFIDVLGIDKKLTGCHRAAARDAGRH